MIGAQVMLDNEDVASGEFADAVNKLGIPVFLSSAARGVLGKNSKIQLRHKETRRKALKEADVVILVS